MKSFHDYLGLSNSCSYDVIGRADRFGFQNFCSPGQVYFIWALFYRSSWSWSDTAFCRVRSGSTLFTEVSLIGLLDISGLMRHLELLDKISTVVIIIINLLLLFQISLLYSAIISYCAWSYNMKNKKLQHGKFLSSEMCHQIGLTPNCSATEATLGDSTSIMSHDMTKSTEWVWAQQRLRSAKTSLCAQ